MHCRGVTLLSPLYLTPIYIPERDGRMMHSATLEEGYFIPLVLGFCHNSYRSPGLLLR